MITYTVAEQRMIARLPVHPESKNGRPRLNVRGMMTHDGFKVGACVGVGLTRRALQPLYRAKHPKTGELILVDGNRSQYPAESLLIGDRILAAQLWQGILNRCLQKSNVGARHYSERGVTCEKEWIPINLEGKPSHMGTAESRIAGLAAFEEDLPELLAGRDLVPGMQSSRYDDCGSYYIGNFEIVTRGEHIEITRITRKRRAA